ncbi:MAG TPA: AarF/UbiB family protein [Puia sp.]|nr:AarF/UbiB family protein [Puia sp.]
MHRSTHIRYRVPSLLLDLGRAGKLFWVVSKFLFSYLFNKNYGSLLRHSFEQMGLTYLKLGQFLALRFDLLPKEVLAEMNNLFENVENVPFERIRQQIERELQRPLEEVYPVFDPVPVGAATVAQVHEAVTFRNERVAVKVQRPGIDRIFRADIRNLRKLSRLADLFHLGGAFVLTDVLDEFDQWTGRELSFRSEANTAERLRRSALPYEIIPRIYQDLSTDKMITMEFIQGLSLAKVIELKEEGGLEAVKERLPDLDLSLIGNRIANAVLRQLFITGFFHGDPHPGNIFIQNNNTVAFLDFGIFGEMNGEQLEILSGHLENIALGNINESFRYYAMQYQPTEDTDMIQFEKEGREVLRRWYLISIDPYAKAEDKHLGKVGSEMFDVIRRNKLKGTTSVLLFWRALYALDVSALKLAEYFDLMVEMKAFFIRIRPGLCERAISTAANRDTHEAIGRLGQEWLPYWDKTLANLSGSDQPVLSRRSPAKQRWLDKETRWLAGGVLALSAVILVTVPRSSLPTPLYLSALLLVSLGLLLFVMYTLVRLLSGKEI